MQEPVAAAEVAAVEARIVPAGATQAQAARPEEKAWITLLRVGSIRYAALYFAPFYTASAMTGHGGLTAAVVGALFCVVFCLGIELANRCADQVEDRINRPERTALCLALGFHDLLVITVLIFSALVPVGVIWFVAYFNTSLFLLQAIIWLIAWNYSYGLRLKGRRFAAPAILSLTFLLPFAVAWTMHESIFRLPVAAWVEPVFIISLCGAKDITDVAGDRVRGYRSLFVDLLKSRVPLALLAWMLVPYAFTSLLILTGQLSARWWAVLAWMPFSLSMSVAARRAKLAEERAAVRELTYHIWFGIMLTVLFLMCPTGRVLGALTLSLAFWVFATRRLHWFVGLRRDQFVAFIRVLRRPAG
jgi:4-hydroxybenzoate polyprenyltransferase